MPTPLESINKMDIINNKENIIRSEDYTSNNGKPSPSPSKNKHKHKKVKKSSSSSSSRHRAKKETTKRKHDTMLLFPLCVLVIIVTFEVFAIERFFFPKQEQQGTDITSLEIRPNNDKSKTESKLTPDASQQQQEGTINARLKSSMSKSNNPPPKLRDPITIVSEALDLKEDLPNDVKQKLPSKEDVTNLYGDTPIILGLDTCQAFRDARPNSEAFVAPAGMFNTGTNLMHEYLHHNCYLPDKVKKYGKISRGMRFQVPWGKHTPASYRLHHLASDAPENLDQTAFLPIVVIKDPFTWMSSMCRHSYAAFWPHDPNQHCPNLVPMQSYEQITQTVGRAYGDGLLAPWKQPSGLKVGVNAVENTDSVHVGVQYSGKSKDRTIYESLAHVWNDWYGEWLNVTSYPFLVIRFEDLVFHAEYIATEVCKCAGGQMRAYDDVHGEHDVHEGFQYIEDSAKTGQKAHEGGSGFTTAMIKYGNAKIRTEPFTEKDMEYAKSVLRKDIMDAFHYVMPP